MSILNRKATSIFGVLLAVVGAIVEVKDMLPESWGASITIVGTVVAAVGRSLMTTPES